MNTRYERVSDRKTTASTTSSTTRCNGNKASNRTVIQIDPRNVPGHKVDLWLEIIRSLASFAAAERKIVLLIAILQRTIGGHLCRQNNHIHTKPA